MDLKLTRTELALLREAERQQALAESADEEFGPDWEENSLDPESPFRRFVSESDLSDTHDRDLAELRDFEQFYG
jgi:hypothetical protein